MSFSQKGKRVVLLGIQDVSACVTLILRNFFVTPPTHLALSKVIGIKDVCSCNRFSCIFACDIWYIYMYSIISKISRSRGLLLNQIVIKKSINKYTIVIIYWFIKKKTKSFLTIKLEFSNMIRDINTNYFSMLYLVFSHWYRLTLVLMYVSDMM